MNINMLMQQAQRMQKDVEVNMKKAKEELGWEAKKGIKEMCEDSWNFIQKNK